MWASSEFAGREGPENVYEHLAGVSKYWTPSLSRKNKKPEDAIFALSEAHYGASPANREIPAAYTFFGQFVTHDITFDTRLDPRTAAGPRHNLRTPALDLDSVYGRGPLDQPYLYELDSPRGSERFWIPLNQFGERDLPRNDDGSVIHPSSGTDFNLRHAALIGDPRNDENVLISQLHLAFLRFHNARVDELRSAGRVREDHIFEEARRLTTWHYQWVLVHDYLRRTCGDEVLDKLAGKHLVLSKPPLLPYEFTLAAFRFGHSMVNSGYYLNSALQHRFLDTPIPLFDDMGADWSSRDRGAESSLEGQRALPADWTVQWDRFVDVGNDLTQWSRRIDPLIAPPLRKLPLRGVAERHRSLAYLTLLRGYDRKLPSGQALARLLKLKIVGDPSDSDPLWIYVLKEADLVHDGRRLGPLATAIVSETLIGLLRHDKRSIVHQRGWTPELSPRNGKSAVEFDLADFLIQAGVPITARQWSQRASS